MSFLYLTSHRWLYHIYLLLFPLTYATLLLDYQSTWVPASILLIWSYWRLFRREQEVVLYLILFSRCINGFLNPYNDTFYNLGNILTCYMPLVIIVIQRFWTYGLKDVHVIWFSRYKFTMLYIIVLIAYSFIDLSVALYGVKTRLQPMIFFALAVTVMMHVFPIQRILLFFRYLFVAMIVFYLVPGYGDTVRNLLMDGVVFKIPIESNQYFILDTYFRNLGIFWDCRVLGLFCVVTIYLALVHRPKGWGWDLLLAYIALLSTFARAPMAIGVIIGLYAFTFGARVTWSRRFARLASAVLLSTAIAFVLYASPLQEYIDSFSLLSDDGALGQRSGFRVYAMEQFKENPFGHGLGFLKSPDIERSINIGNGALSRASDAFWFILLAEVGIFGTILFALSFWEIIFRRSAYTIILLGGLAITLLGTDIPDMGAYYFVFLILICRDFNRVGNHECYIPEYKLLA